jgi:hypothetical protein
MSARRPSRDPSFVLELDGQAVFAFSARTMRKARALCTRDWLSHELAPFRSRGRPLWHDASQFTVRPSTAREDAELRIARANEIFAHEFDGYTFVFLVPLDPALQ